ncbi:MAG TPA: hypothetical protein VFG09_03800 [Thermodesulfovibrionales bacterium]|jgi:hypothetical protein|nr:hypothetical protein [Thermodesulfovibrionales bacterium]
MADPEVKELAGADLEFVEAEFLTIRQSTVRSVEGGHVELQQVGALSLDGERVEMTQSASTIVRGGDITLNQGISVVTAGNAVSLNYSFSQISLSRDSTTVSRSAVGIMGARTITAENSASILTIANRVEGEMTTLLDWRSALALGAVFGGILGFFSLFRKR